MKQYQLINKLAINYNDEEGIIVAVAPISMWQSLKPYDNSGWMDEEEMQDEIYEGVEFLVAMEDSEGDVEVYTFENGGVELI